VPPLVAMLSGGGFITWIIVMAVLFGAFFGAQMVSKTPGVNVIALHGAAFISGVFIAPMVFFALLMASQGQTLVASPVRDAFLLSSVGFAGLSAYTLVSKKDFSYLGGFLSMGFFVVLGGLVLTFFLHSSVFALAIDSVAVLLFGGYILYDTSRILRSGNDNPVGAAILLYLDFFNLFIFLLSILSSRRN
jgi:modulator of FtsH protease